MIDFVLTTGGNARWYEQSDVYRTAAPAWRSGAIGGSQNTWLRAIVVKNSALSFYWKVSSEGGYDKLTFSINGSVQDTISGTVDWTLVSHNVTAGQVIEWKYAKDITGNSGSDAGWVDDISFAYQMTMDVPVTDLTTGGDANWSEQGVTYYSAPLAWQSGDIAGGQSTWLQHVVKRNAILLFTWKVSSEAYDKLTFYINGASQTYISGTVDWIRLAYSVTAGQTIKWTYAKDATGDAGSDAGWVDDITMLFPAQYLFADKRYRMDINGISVKRELLTTVKNYLYGSGRRDRANVEAISTYNIFG